MNNRHDFYYKKAKEENYKARSVYKLEEAQKKFNFIKSNDFVLDVGCSPGSFSQYMLNKVLKTGSVIGVDIIPTTFKHERFQFIEGNIRDINLDEFVSVNKLFNIVISDAMPNTTSDKETNHLRSISLCDIIFKSTINVLKTGGHLFIKTFDGRDLNDFKSDLSDHFTKVSTFKPKSSRNESREIFLLASSKKE